MLCHVKSPKFGFLELQVLRNKCIVSAYPWGIPCLGAFKYDIPSDRFFVKSSKWIEFSTIENPNAIDQSTNDIFLFLNVFQIAEIKNAVREAVKWTEFWYDND